MAERGGLAEMARLNGSSLVDRKFYDPRYFIETGELVRSTAAVVRAWYYLRQTDRQKHCIVCTLYAQLRKKEWEKEIESKYRGGVRKCSFHRIHLKRRNAVQISIAKCEGEKIFRGKLDLGHLQNHYLWTTVLSTSKLSLGQYFRPRYLSFSWLVMRKVVLTIHSFPRSFYIAPFRSERSTQSEWVCPAHTYWTQARLLSRENVKKGEEKKSFQPLKLTRSWLFPSFFQAA